MTEESTEGSIMSDEMAAARVAEGLDPVLGGTSIAERALASAPAAAPDAQGGLFDQEIENDLLERALEKRQAAKEANAKTAKVWKEANDQARGIISSLDLEEDTVVRCGRFRIKFSSVEARHVSFDTEPTTRTTIALLPEDE